MFLGMHYVATISGYLGNMLRVSVDGMAAYSRRDSFATSGGGHVFALHHAFLQKHQVQPKATPNTSRPMLFRMQLGL